MNKGGLFQSSTALAHPRNRASTSTLFPRSLDAVSTASSTRPSDGCPGSSCASEKFSQEDTGSLSIKDSQCWGSRNDFPTPEHLRPPHTIAHLPSSPDLPWVCNTPGAAVQSDAPDSDLSMVGKPGSASQRLLPVFLPHGRRVRGRPC